MNKRDYWGPNSFRVRRSRWKAAALRPFGIHTAVYSEIRTIPFEIGDDGELVMEPGALFGPTTPEQKARIDAHETGWAEFRAAFVRTLFTMPTGSKLIVGNLLAEYARTPGSLDRYASFTVLDDDILAVTSCTFDLDHLPPSRRRGLIDLSMNGWAPPAPEEGMQEWFRFADRAAPDSERARLARATEKLFVLYSQASLPDELVFEALVAETGEPLRCPELELLGMKSAGLRDEIPPRRPVRQPDLDLDDDEDDEFDWDDDEYDDEDFFDDDPHPIVRTLLRDDAHAVRARLGDVDGLSYHQPIPYVTFALVGVIAMLYAIGAAQAHSVWDSRASWVNTHASLWLPRVADGQWHRVLTNEFAHTRWTGAVVAAVLLFFAGRELEVLIGRSRLLAILLASTLGSSAALVWLIDFPTLGTIGYIEGLTGALIVCMTAIGVWRVRVAIAIAACCVAFVWWGPFDPVFTASGLGGFTAGILAAIAMLYLPRWLRRVSWPTLAIGWAGTAAVIMLPLALIGAAAISH
ncbi:rhomboid family intramembrane serine protease [Nocardia sp. NPDC055321]